jgi:serine/threonine-protein kinase
VIAYENWPRPPERTERNRYLAIVPFKNLSADPKVEFFSLGLTGAVQARLASLEGISVVDPTGEVASVPGWKPSRVVDLLVEGELVRSEDRVRITYKILEGVDAAERIIVDAGTLDGRLGEILDFQDNVAETICRAVAGHCDLAIALKTAPQPTGDAVAYDLYLQARGYLSRPGEPRNVDMAVDLFQMALARDAEFALARAGLGEAYWSRFLATRDTAWAAKALDTAREAVVAATNRVEPHLALATILLGSGSVDSAAAEFRRVTEMDPGNDAGIRGLAEAEERLGRLDAAESIFRQAAAARPSDWRSHNELGVFYFRNSRIEEALACFRRVVDLAPDSARGYSNLGAIFQTVGRNKEAMEAYERSLALKPSLRAYSNLATLQRSLGRLNEAARNYEKALAIDDGNYRVWAGLADTYKRMPGMTARADSALDRATALAERQLASNPRDALLLATLSQFYAERGRTNDARQAAASALAIAPNQPNVLFSAGFTFESLGERDAALDAIEKAIGLGLPIDLVRSEPGLASLVEDPRFGSLASAESLPSPEAGR